MSSFFNSTFNWNCCSSKPAQHKEHDLSFEEGSPTPGIMKRPSGGTNIELRSKGSKTVIEQQARLLRAHTLKKLGNSGPKQAESEQQSEYELNDEVAEAAVAQDGGRV